MTLRLLAEVSPQELVQGLGDLHLHIIGYVKSMALKCAVDLGIPDAIHRRGSAATLADIVADTAVHPCKVPDLQRLMQLLTTSGIFICTTLEDGSGDAAAAVVYRLTTACCFLVGSHNLSPLVPFATNPLLVSSLFSMPRWLRCEPAAAGSLFEVAHGCSLGEMASKDAGLNTILNASMAADSKLFLEVVVLDKGHIFGGLRSLVDVGGGHGAATQVIAAAFPRIKCSVLDLPHVLAQAPVGDGKVQFIAGDLFESIHSADAVLLKNILHDWGHDDCVNILKRCKEAIPARNARGKVIIIEMVRGSGNGDSKTSEMEDVQNMFMMCLNGTERDENEWKKIISEAGFSDDYKIMPVLGPLSVIEIYP